jgi:hypothetical protein
LREIASRFANDSGLLFMGQCGSHWHLGSFMEIMPLAPFLPLLFGLFSPLLFAAKPDLAPGDSDRVTGTAIIREINLARQNPTLYVTFLEQTRQNYAGRVRLMPGSVRLCTHEGVRAVD